MDRSIILLMFLVFTHSKCEKTLENAKKFLSDFDVDNIEMSNKLNEASWNYATNITEINQKLQAEASVAYTQNMQKWSKMTEDYDWKQYDDTLKRQFKIIAEKGESVLSKEDLYKMQDVMGQMETIYSTAKVCDCSKAQCYPLDPDLTQMFKSEQDFDYLRDLWKGWRDVSGKRMKKNYEELVEYENLIAKGNGFADAGEYWRSNYEIDGMESEMEKLWDDVKPLYQNLHAYVLRKLKSFYEGKAFPKSNHIPAHLLGNMWAQQWYIYDITAPYKNATKLDVTKRLVEQQYTAKKIAEKAEYFFESIGLDKMPASFWTKSLLEKPADREVVCHASAWDFSKDSDFRIKQCTKINMEWLQTTHHEMGHIQYYLQYKDQPMVFRNGANPGFHEAVGDIMMLSASTPAYLKEVGLLEADDFDANDSESEINYLFQQALEKVAFLPFGYLIDRWRWDVFSRKTKPENYNRDWWKLRCKYQGVSPPVARNNDDFDPGAKYHVPSNVPYIRYFVSYIIQYQIHEALCKEAKFEGPLHQCSIYNSKEAGQKLGDMLKMGSSRPWTEAMKAVTGNETMDTSSILKYFEPLMKFLEKENEGHEIDWSDKCPEGSFSNSGSTYTISSVLLIVITFKSYL